MFDLSDLKFDAIVFDCDGTIADNMPLHFEAWKYALEKEHAPFELTPEMIMSRAGVGMHEVVRQLNEIFASSLDSKKVGKAKDEYFEKNHTKVKPIPEVMEVVQLYHGKLPMAVASGSRTKSVQRTLANLGITDWFHPVITVDDVENGKPAPDMFLLAAEKMGVKPESCIVFEDGELGIRAAEAAGMKWFRVESRL